MFEILSYVCGVLAVVFFLICFQLKKRKSIITCNIISRVLYILQYCFVGGFVGAMMDVTAVPSSAIAGKKDHPFVKKYKIIILIAVNLLIIAVGVVTALLAKSVTVVDFLPILGVLFETIALWFSSEKMIRIISFMGAPFWLIYNIIYTAYASAVGNVLTMVSIIVALIRYKESKKEKAIDK